MQIRRAYPSDVPAIARVHVDTWRTTYAGIVPEEFLANLTCESREGQWRSFFEGENRSSILLIAEEAGQSVGFACGGPEREGHTLYSGELYAIYLQQHQQRRGTGRRLTEAVAKFLLEEGHQAMLVWVLKDNPSRGFYEHGGGQYVAEKEIDIGGSKLIEIAYGWPDIRTLISQD